MLKVLKNLKESALLVVAIFILLCIQAGCDLNLPDFTSKIVNTGIQQGGIEYAVPEAITSSKLENLMYFTDADDEIKSNYELMEKTVNNLEEYPELQNQEIYKLKNLSNEEKTHLESLMAKPLAIVYQLENEDTVNIDLIKQMPNEQRKTILEQIDSTVSTMTDSIIKQAGIQAVKSEYSSIGMDLDSLQNKYILIIFQLVCIRIKLKKINKLSKCDNFQKFPDWYIFNFFVFI